MIVTLHSLCLLLQRFVKYYRITKAIDHFQNIDLMPHVKTHIRCNVTDTFELRFDPPICKQRYGTVQQILLNPSWKLNIKKVVVLDRELTFFSYIKYLYDIQEIIYVDMESLKSKVYRLSPSRGDYIRPRPNHLKLQALSGSPSQPDKRLAGCDAVIAIEVIQELYPDTLEGLPYNVFHYIQPLLAIFTVSNAEFNIPLPCREKNRCDTHKFEWTREQFQLWALNITARFPNYTVRFRGIAEGPEDMESFGCYTQAAIFFRHSKREQQISKSWRDDNESYGICTYCAYVKQSEPFFDENNGANCYYKEFDCSEYSYKIDNRTPDERILCHVEERLSYSTTRGCMYYNGLTNRIEYPLYQLVSNENGCFTTVSELSIVLKKNGYKIEDCPDFYFSQKSPCIIYDPTVEIKKVENKDSSSEYSSVDDEEFYFGIENSQRFIGNGTYKLSDRTAYCRDLWNVTPNDFEVEKEVKEDVKAYEVKEYAHDLIAEEFENFEYSPNFKNNDTYKASDCPLYWNKPWSAIGDDFGAEEKVEHYDAEEEEVEDCEDEEEVEGYESEDCEGEEEVEDYDSGDCEGEELEDYEIEEEVEGYEAEEEVEDYEAEEEVEDYEAEEYVDDYETEESRTL